MIARELNWSIATGDDIGIVLALMRDFYEEEQLVYDKDRSYSAVSDLLADPSIGMVFLLRCGSDTYGYCVGSFGFTLEFGGRFILLDELYISPAARGRGEGKRALSILESWAEKRGAVTARLEVSHHNQKALAIYLKFGYLNDERRILTKWLSEKEGIRIQK